MPRRILTEQTVIFISILKWLVLASVTGVVVGTATAIFLKILAWSQIFGSEHKYYFLALPAALVVTVLLIKHIAPEAEGHGTEKVIEAVHKRSGRIDPLVVPVKLLGTIITLAAGGSVGKEGPCAQIGAGLSSFLADLFRFSMRDRKKLVICGISAGFASVFGTPIAGAIFGVEVLFVGSLLYDVLLPSFVAGIVSYQVSYSLGIRYFHHSINVMPVFSEKFFLIVVLAGIVFGLWSAFLIGILRAGEALAKRYSISAPLKALIGGCILVALAFVFGDRYLGLGLGTIESSLTGTAPGWHAPFLKSLFTSITLACGGSGGIVTPIFFVGSTAGAMFGKLLGLHVATFAAIGMVSLLAGAAQTPISASIMAVEIFGPAVAPYAAIACVISFLMTGHRSVYPSQVLAIRKSPSLSVEIGKVIDNVEVEFSPREKSLIALIRRIPPLNPKARDKGVEEPKPDEESESEL
ncbi:MAG: chloride channel protein [Armatimonadetes bacterium]|nr:chloride channel protein [Armatimonadota bacterium]